MVRLHGPWCKAALNVITIYVYVRITLLHVIILYELWHVVAPNLEVFISLNCVGDGLDLETQDFITGEVA
jgi:hypothetical protein